MSPSESYLHKCHELMQQVEAQITEIQTVADWFSTSILQDGLVHLFGSGHSRIMVEEMWPRYGSFPGFHPMVELSLTFHNQVTGSNGQRQAMFLENVPGFAARILRNFDISKHDSALIISSSGCNIVQIEMAELMMNKGQKVVAMVSLKHLEASQSKRADGKKLIDYADIVLDTGAPAGDAMVTIEGLVTPVSPGSTVGGVMLINAIKAEVAKRLVDAGHPPQVLTASAICGPRKSADLFESAYDEHSRRMSRLHNIPK